MVEDAEDDGHRRTCSTSCTDCIRYYSNQGEHGLMDWRLGLDLLRVLADPEEVLLGDEEDDLSARIAGLDAHDNRRDLLEHYQRLAHRLVAAGGQGFTTSTFAGLLGSSNIGCNPCMRCCRFCGVHRHSASSTMSTSPQVLLRFRRWPTRSRADRSARQHIQPRLDCGRTG